MLALNAIALFSALAAGASSAPVTARIDCSAAQSCDIHPSVEQVFDVAQKLAAAERYDEAIDLLKVVSHDNNTDYRAEARVRIARYFIAKGDKVTALSWYRQLLDEKPEASSVRVEVAALLADMGDVSAAKHQLRQAQAGGLPPEVAQVINQYANALRSYKSWGGSFELDLAPDSNINRATDARTLDTVIAPLNLSRDARERSGVGLKGSGQLYVRANLNKDLTLVPRVSGLGTFYRDSQFNDISASAQLGLEWRMKSDRFTPSAGLTRRWYGGDLYARTQSLSLDWLHPAGKRAQIDIDWGISKVRYIRNSFQGGTIYNASVSYERAFSARSGASLALSANRQTARDPGYATTSGGIGLVYWHDFGKFTVFGTANVNRLEADERLFLYPQRRKELYARGGLGAVFRHVQVAGFSPVLRVAYERNWSTVGIYDYRRIVTEAGVTRSF